MRRTEDPCRDPASEARDDWAEREPNPMYVDAPHEVHCIRYDRVTGEMLTLVATSEAETRKFFQKPDEQ